RAPRTAEGAGGEDDQIAAVDGLSGRYLDRPVHAEDGHAAEQEARRDGAEVPSPAQKRQRDQAVEQRKGQEQGEGLAELGDQAQEIVVRHASSELSGALRSAPADSGRAVWFTPR